MDTEAIITAKQLVQEALWQAKRPKSDYFRFFQFFHAGYMQLRLGRVNEGVKFSKQTPGTLNEVDFPEDMIQFVAIGVPVDGKFYQFTRDNNIIMTTTSSGGQETQDSDVGEGVDILDNATYGFYARGGVNLEGYYNIDYEERRIFLNSTTRTDIVLAYVSSGTKVSEDTYVPVLYRRALIAWIIWQDAIYDDKRIKVAEYYEMQYNKAVLSLPSKYTLQEYLDAWCSTYTMLPLR